MDKLKKSGMDMDMDIQQMDWVEDNKKVNQYPHQIFLTRHVLTTRVVQL